MYMKHGKVKFGYKDSYDCTTSLSPIIADCIRNFRDTLIRRNEEGCFLGVPNVVLVDLFGAEYVQQKNQSGGLTEDDIQQGLEHWLTILDQIIYAFGSEEPDYEGGFTEGEQHGEENEDGYTRWNLLVEPLQWKEYMEARDAWHEQVEHGRMLFSKFYDCLWW